MKKILLITSIYPKPSDNEATGVCHYFTKEWHQLGYDVRVVHIQSVFPHIFYWGAKLAGRLIRAKTGAVVYTKADREVVSFNMDGVNITRIPTFKPYPHAAYPQREIKKVVEKIKSNNDNDGFVPDVIVGHFPNPQLEIINILKQYYGHTVKTSMIVHEDYTPTKKLYGKRFETLIKGVDIWGFRSKPLYESFVKTVGNVEDMFYCYSGIPERYLIQKRESFTTTLNHFIFVGSLFKLKKVDVSLKALSQVFGTESFMFDIVGEGAEMNRLKSLAKNLNISTNVRFYGNVARERLQSIVATADCFIMVSAPEAFGLVYLEAMAKGCIVVGSKGQGIDGVIIDGYNGFLCEPDNPNHLADVIRKIRSMSQTELIEMSNNALDTARKLTDANVAKMYVDSII